MDFSKLQLGHFADPRLCASRAAMAKRGTSKMHAVTH
jgi:hypothetical protein